MLVLFLLAAVLLSAVLEQVIPKASSPLIQIALGIIIALFATSQITVNLNTEFFLVMFIAPLLFNEAKRADKSMLWKNRFSVASLGIGLVVVITLIVGFVLNLLVPSIPLAAAFALGAALGPTDVVAVQSFSKSGRVPEHPRSVLEGEALINDASGVVSFQFAIAAVTTGAFSLLDATLEFALDFFGGILAGLLLGLLLRFCVQKVRDIGLESITFHVLLEIFTPFIVYLAAEAMHVSGILAVVAAGLVGVINPRSTNPNISRMNIVSSSVWQVISFALNGVVFVLLGTQLPGAMTRTWEDASIGNWDLLLYIGIVLVLIVVVRLLWTMAMEAVLARREGGRFDRESFRDAVIMTLGGAKGTVTLAVMFTIPVFMSTEPYIQRFPQRDLLIFIACGVIVCTLLMSNFLTPLFLPKPRREKGSTSRIETETLAKIDIMRSVIEDLAASQNEKNEMAVQAVIRDYNERINAIKDNHGMTEEPDNSLRLMVLEWERLYVTQLIMDNEVNAYTGYQYIRRLARHRRLLERGRGGLPFKSRMLRWRNSLRSFWQSLSKGMHLGDTAERNAEFRELQIASGENVIMLLQEMLADPDSSVPTEEASVLLMEYQDLVRKLSSSRPSITAITRAENQADEIRLKGYRKELELIQQMFDEGRLSRGTANKMRDNVYLMQIDLESEVR
ncbi:MAG: sodium:proton antiporter [Coriobacteriales bacterium]|nr:sodium:proton antiporter [Coriobacteriales bacterium]